METVRHFVCIDADQAVPYMIDLLIEIIQRNFLKGRKEFAKPVINGNPEILVSSQNIFVEAGLALMKAHITAASGDSIVIFRIDVLLENAVPALVDGGEDGA